MLRRTKMIIAGYCIGGLIILAIAIGMVLQFTGWIRHPEQLIGHDHHHHGEQVRPPEAYPAETYMRGGRVYLKSPFLKRDFDVTHSSVNLAHVLYVSLGASSFPALDELKFVSPDDAVGIPEEDTVVGVSVGGEDKAYPLRMLNYHIVLSDVCGGKDVAVVWDPLTMTPKVFDRRLERSDGTYPTLTFANLGLIYRGGFLLHDDTTGSIWWPPEGRCLAGDLNGRQLGDFPFMLVSWKVWKERHPEARILSTDTPFSHRYTHNPYGVYYPLSELPFPVQGWKDKDSAFRWSEPVIALEVAGKAKAYPLSVLSEAKGDVQDTFGGMKIIIHKSLLPYPTDEEGLEIRYSFGAWFLWSVRYPEIEVYRGS